MLSESKQVGLFPCRGSGVPCRTLYLVSATCKGTVKPWFARPAASGDDISTQKLRGACRSRANNGQPVSNPRRPDPRNYFRRTSGFVLADNSEGGKRVGINRSFGTCSLTITACLT